MNKQEILQRLKNNGCRITNTRKGIVECLFDIRKHTIKDFLEHLKISTHEDVNLSTVYNTLEILVQENVIDMNIDYPNREIYYELVDWDICHIHTYHMLSKKESCKKLDKKTTLSIKNQLNLQESDNIKILVHTK